MVRGVCVWTSTSTARGEERCLSLATERAATWWNHPASYARHMTVRICSILFYFGLWSFLSLPHLWLLQLYPHNSCSSYPVPFMSSTYKQFRFGGTRHAPSSPFHSKPYHNHSRFNHNAHSNSNSNSNSNSTSLFENTEIVVVKYLTPFKISVAIPVVLLPWGSIPRNTRPASWATLLISSTQMSTNPPLLPRPFLLKAPWHP